MKPVAFGMTDVGKCRKINQDELLIDETRGLFAVADGMGGHAAGEVASQMAIEALTEAVPDDDGKLAGDPDAAARWLACAFREGNRMICESVMTRGEWRGMGTTIVALLTLGDRVVIGHVGDSRAYLLRDDALQRLTSDHSYVNEQVKLGLLTDDEAQRHPMRNIVTRALGNRTDLEVELRHHDVHPGDVYLLCSDGLNSMLHDEEIAGMLRDNAGNPEQACQALVAAANERGGEDNITVIVLQAPES